MKSLGSSFNDLLKSIKTIFNNITVSFSLTQGSPPPSDLDFGLCARVSQRFYFTLSPRSFFHTGQRFPIQKHVTSGLGDVTSGSGDVTSGSGHVTETTIFMVRGFRCYAQPLSQSQTRPGGVYANYRGKFCYLGAHYY